MAEIRWTPQASDDLEAIAEFISLDSPHYASIFVMDVFNAVDQLEIVPTPGELFQNLTKNPSAKSFSATTGLSIASDMPS